MSLENILAEMTDADPAKRIAALVSVQDTPYPQALPAVGQRLRDDVDTGVRFQAAKTLGAFADTSSLPDLLDGLRDVDMFVRVHVTDTLIRIGIPAVAGLLDALRDESAPVRRAAAKALGKIRDAGAVSGLLAALLDVDADVRRFAAQALGRIGDEATAEALGDALRDDDVRVRKAAAGALWDMGDVSVPILQAALEDPNPQTVIIAAYTLTKMGYTTPDNLDSEA